MARPGDFPACSALWFAVVTVFLLVALPKAVRADEAPTSLFFGPFADHFMDSSGQLTIEDLIARPGDAPFRPYDGRRAANYGPARSLDNTLWLRFTFPSFASASDGDRVLALREPRVRKVSLYIPKDGGWRELTWRIAELGGSSTLPTRYPVLIVPAAEVTGRTLYMRIQTPSSMRASLWLHTELDFVGASSIENLLFGLAFGILAALVTYLAASGIVARDVTSLTLSGLVFAYLVYVLGDQGFIGTVVLPGNIRLGRFMSLGGTFLIFSTMILYTILFLRIESYYQRLAKVAIWISFGISVVALLAILSIILEQQFIRRLVAPIGISSIVLCLTLVAVAWRTDRKRAIVFATCWGPMFAGGLARMLHDVVPAIGANPIALNFTYLAACLSLLMSGFANALDLQGREREARRAAEHSAMRLRAFAESASDSFWECDREGRTTFGSGPACEALGLRRGTLLQDLIGRDLETARSKALADFQNSLAAGSEFRAVIRLPGPEGDVRARQFAFRARPAGPEGGLRGIVSDITEEVATQERIAQQRKMAAVGQLAGGVAHEINNLLHPMVNLAKRVARGIPEHDDRRRLLDIVAESGNRAAHIVAGLLTSVRPPSRHDSHAPLGTALGDAIKSLREMLSDKVRLNFESYGDPGPPVDSNEAFQVLANLVANAVYATRGGGQVDVRFTGTNTTGYQLTVEDNGEGMDSETRERAMEPFFTTKQPGQGTGLGLPIVFGIVHAWRASLNIESQPGLGTRVTVVFPGNAASETEMPHDDRKTAQG